MAERILQINFKFSVTRAEYEQAAMSLVSAFADVAGLRWKVWLMNEADSEAGGIYLFDDDSSLQAFLAGPLAAQVKAHPAFSDMSAKQFEVMADVTAITRGPV
jgi:hypothetical protein